MQLLHISKKVRLGLSILSKKGAIASDLIFRCAHAPRSEAHRSRRTRSYQLCADHRPHVVERYDAKVVGTDSLADIAVLKIDAENLPPATLGDSDKLMVGDGVFAIGNPFGVGLSVSRGIVSALSRGNLGIEQIEDFIQTDAATTWGILEAR